MNRIAQGRDKSIATDLWHGFCGFEPGAGCSGWKYERIVGISHD
jgi:hypothetical protein